MTGCLCMRVCVLHPSCMVGFMSTSISDRHLTIKLVCLQALPVLFCDLFEREVMRCSRTGSVLVHMDLGPSGVIRSSCSCH